MRCALAVLALFAVDDALPLTVPGSSLVEKLVDTEMVRMRPKSSSGRGEPLVAEPPADGEPGEP